MRKSPAHHFVFAALFGLLALVLATTGCSGDDMACTPGAVDECPCPGGGQGVQTCLDDGTFGECDCDAAPNQTDPDAGFPDDADPGPDADPPGDFNACGGEDTLVYDGAEASPGDDCGDCGDGTLICDGVDDLRCIGATEPNECGGCEPLPAAPESDCGACGDGTYQCTDDGDSLECVDATPPNDCGGCSTLSNTPGFACDDGGETGFYQCTNPDEVICVVSGMNACGGTSSLEAPPTTSCGVCDGGIWACDGDDAVTCEDEDAGTNACGGCALLDADPGDSCGECGGQWECDGTDGLVCDDPTNACGGCATLADQPGTPCGNGGAYTCDGPDAVVCDEDVDTNACGGTATLSDDPGDSCGECDDGEIICVAPDTTACVGASSTNACSGCTALAGLPGTECAGESEWTCVDDDNVECVFLGEYNQCGGTEDLDDVPGTECGDCGIWICEDENTVACEGDTDIETDPENCGECGNMCTVDEYCDSGTCTAYNACGGTEELDGIPDEECEDCGVWTCDGDDAVYCDGGTDTQTDPDNCGQCGNVCVDGEYCESGVCEVDKVIEVAAGQRHTCALRESGEVICWGDGSNGQLSDGSIDNAVSITAGQQHSCALLDDGTIKCWGGNNFGQLGSGNDIGGSQPQLVVGIDDGQMVSAGPYHTCAVENEEIYCWGSNSYGQLGNGTTEGSQEPVAVSGNLPTPIDDISAGHRHTCAVAGGSAYCWGRGQYGRLGHGSTSDSSTPVAVSGLSSASQITAGYRHTCALSSSGIAYCWGDGSDGRLGNGDTQYYSTAQQVIALGGAARISAGFRHTCAIRDTDNTVYCWGSGSRGATGLGTTDDYSVPQHVDGISDAVDLSTALNTRHTCAVRDNGQVACWGQNDVLQLGDGQRSNNPWDRWTPVLNPDIPPVTTEYGKCFNNDDHSGNGLVDCEDPDCAADLGDDTGVAVASGQLLGFAGNYTGGSCGGDGPEDVYAWTAPETGTFVFDTGDQFQGSSQDVLLILREDSCLGIELGCDLGGGTDGRARLEVEVEEGEQYYLIVGSDSSSGWWLSDDGVYYLNIEKAD